MPTFSFTDLLRPPEGWKVEHAILTTYSADLVVIVTALLALTDCDLDYRRTGSRVELVKAIEALRGRVRVLAQAGHVAIPRTAHPILKLLDQFLETVVTDENSSSWHPKVALLRYHSLEDATDRFWRVWLGSRNLTRAMNWEAGLILTSRADGRGQKVAGLASLGASLAGSAKLARLSAADVEKELTALTWECPPGCEVQKVSLFGPELAKGLPVPPANTERVFVVSPFLDSHTVRAMATWGNAGTRRTLVSTAVELQRLWQQDNSIFSAGFASVCMLPLPDLPVEGADLLEEEAPAAVETAESEELQPAGLHAKLFLATNRTQRQLWVGSANATDRGWAGRNYEAVAEMLIGRDTANALEEFIATCEQFQPKSLPSTVDENEQALEQARKLLASGWPLRQLVGEDAVEVVATLLPPLNNPAVQVEIAELGGVWNLWPHDVNRIMLPGVRRSQRSDFLQIRLSCGGKMCAWLQRAPCDPPPDEGRDSALIAQYLNPRTFLLWLRSLLDEEAARTGGGDWDVDDDTRIIGTTPDWSKLEADLMPTVEEILRAWARDSSAFIAADEKVKAYLSELQQRARESEATADVKLLQTFQMTWNTLATELR